MTLDYGIMVYSLLWVMQDLYHQPVHQQLGQSRSSAAAAMQALARSTWKPSCFERGVAYASHF